MRRDIIFSPMLAMMALTTVVWFYMYARRIPAMRRARLKVQSYTTPDAIAAHLPADVNYAAYNLKNLFELPVIFYALCLYLYVVDNVDSTFVLTAWTFFLFRLAHSMVHCTKNIVILRFYLYAAASISLWFMLARAIWQHMATYA